MKLFPLLSLKSKRKYNMPEPRINKEPALSDYDMIPFGKYKDREMADVPASYLLWLWDEHYTNIEVDNYISNNLNALKQECPDTIVRRIN